MLKQETSKIHIRSPGFVSTAACGKHLLRHMKPLVKLGIQNERTPSNQTFVPWFVQRGRLSQGLIRACEECSGAAWSQAERRRSVPCVHVVSTGIWPAAVLCVPAVQLLQLVSIQPRRRSKRLFAAALNQKQYPLAWRCVVSSGWIKRRAASPCQSHLATFSCQVACSFAWPVGRRAAHVLWRSAGFPGIDHRVTLSARLRR